MWRGILLVACLGMGGIVTPATCAAASPRSNQANLTASVTAKLVLSHTTVTAGTTIKGTWIFTNTTANPILVSTCTKDIWDGVGLQTEQIPVSSTEPLTPLLLCRPSLELSPGANRFPVQVSTSFVDYGPCYSPSSTTRTPLCHSLSRTGQPPPLPPGKYTTKFLIRGMPADFQLPAPMTVMLRPSSHLPKDDGVVIGTAAPCIGVAVTDGISHTWTVHVQLQRGTTVVGSRLVTDSYQPVQKVVDQPFMFTEPAGRYLAVGPGGRMPVVIHPGRTTSVAIPDYCA